MLARRKRSSLTKNDSQTHVNLDLLTVISSPMQLSGMLHSARSLKRRDRSVTCERVENSATQKNQPKLSRRVDRQDKATQYKQTNSRGGWEGDTTHDGHFENGRGGSIFRNLLLFVELSPGEERASSSM